jgi:hypothetical protein
LSDFKSASGLAADSDIADPQFVNPTNRHTTADFRLQSTSPARGNASDLTVDWIFYTLYLLDITFDFEEHFRAFDTGDDMGALEY